MEAGIWYLLGSPARTGPGRTNNGMFVPQTRRFETELP